MDLSKPTESEFQRELWAALNAPGSPVRVERQNAGRVLDYGPDGRVRGAMHGARKGSGDLAGWVRGPGWHLEVEVKVDAAHTAAQKRRAAAVERDGAIYVLVRWQRELDLHGNVLRGAAAVEAAIDARRMRA